MTPLGRSSSACGLRGLSLAFHASLRSPCKQVYDFGERQVGRQRCARHSRVTVTYGCQRGAADEIVAVSEFGACEYWLQVATDRVW